MGFINVINSVPMGRKFINIYVIISGLSLIEKNLRSEEEVKKNNGYVYNVSFRL